MNKVGFIQQGVATGWNRLSNISNIGVRLREKTIATICCLIIVWMWRHKLDGAALVSIVDIEKQLTLNFRKGSKPGKIQPYAFKGVLHVKNPSAFKSLLQQGIGPTKAFGCGMLSLAAV